jgi:hypothetical protein
MAILQRACRVKYMTKQSALHRSISDARRALIPHGIETKQKCGEKMADKFVPLSIHLVANHDVVVDEVEAVPLSIHLVANHDVVVDEIG